MNNNYDKKMESKSFLPYKMEHLTDWMIEKAKTELNETDEKRAKAMSELRKLIARDKELDVWTDDAYLLQFLRARKFDVKKAWELFRTFYTVKKEFSDVYPVDFDFNDFRKLGETNVAGAYNYRNKDGSVVLYAKAELWDANIYPLKTVLIGLTAMLLASVEYPATQVCGVHFIIDLKGFTWQQFRTVTPRYLRLLANGLRSAFPVRFKGIHLLNEPVLFTYLSNILKMFLTDKLTKRMHSHGNNMENLHKYISKDILPPEYGGENTNYSGREWCSNELDLYTKRFIELLSKGYP